MPNIDDIIEKTTVRFKESINSKELKSLLKVLASKGYCFRMSQSGFLNVDSKSYEDYISSIQGSVSRDNPFRSASITFHSSYENGDIPRFNQVGFFVAPGYSWEEIPAQERELIESLKKDIQNTLR